MKKVGLLIGLMLAVLMLVMPAPEPREAAPASPTAADVVPPETLSDWILGADPAYFLIDVRPEAAYLEEHIKTAVSLPAASLDASMIKSLPAHRRLVVYASDTDAAVAAWQAIRPHRPGVYVLEGGMAAWRDRVLEPAAPAADASDAEWQRYQRRLAAATYYLGKDVEAPVQRERVVSPVLRPRTAGVANEGC